MNITLDGVSQVGLTIFSIVAIVMVARKNKWGFVIGLLSEPFWFVTSYINKQWGIFVLSVVYSGTWAYGIYKWFYGDEQKADAE